MENIIYFNKDLKKLDESTKQKLGIRGSRAAELAAMGLPIAPGFIIDSELTLKLPHLENAKIVDMLRPHVNKLEKETKKKFGDAEKPMLLKVVLSSDLNVPNFPSIHNIGMNSQTVEGFGKFTGIDFAYGEYLYLMRNLGQKIYLLDEATAKKIEMKIPKKPKIEQIKEALDAYKEQFGDKCSEDVYEQLACIVKGAAAKYCDSDIDVDNSLSMMIQIMVHGNYGKNSYSGNYYTRNIITGDPEIQGEFIQNEFDFGDPMAAKDISKIEKKYYDKFVEIAHKLEQNFLEIRNIKFTIEEGDFWLVEQRECVEKSNKAQIKTLLDLNQKKIVPDEYIITHVKPNQLNELLHPVIDSRTAKGIKTIQGGIAGSTGAAIGRVFFSTSRLLEEHKHAIMNGEDTDLILVMTVSYAEDVKAIEVAQGVITTEGGFSSHAPVVARSLGKVAMVQPEMKIRGNTFTLAGKVVSEGDYVSINVPYYEAPTIYLGKVDLIMPDYKTNGLMDFLTIAENFIDGFDVRANADQGNDAILAREFKAKGIGLCRTEHMFFNEKRIMRFREMIIANNEQERRKVLNALLPMQRSDFYDLFKIMENYPVTIRLLDAPLHEFLPRNEESMNEFIKYLHNKNAMKSADVRARCAELSEMNPMLGHRGCRVAVTYPEIYEMQCRAIFEAACMLKKEGIDVTPEIMIPIVMSEQEIKFIKNGKKIEGCEVKGIRDIRDEVLEEYGMDELDYKIGTMIELPAAALAAGNIAQYAEFFSFGTNDLTQTTYGLSRDDSNSFFPSYSLFDLMRQNPFKYIGEEVKELIGIAALRGKLTRPDIKMGLCGEHGANPENIQFCMDAGLDYVSCSPFAIPLAKLGIAQINIRLMQEKEEEE